MSDHNYYAPHGADHFVPHGACWLWDRWLIALHTIPDMVTMLAYLSIPLLISMIYRSGHIKSLVISFPSLWRLAIAFIFFCGLSHLGSAAEVWVGGSLYYWTGANKILMAMSSSWFTIELYRRRVDIVSIARIVGRTVEAINTDDAMAGRSQEPQVPRNTLKGL